VSCHRRHRPEVVFGPVRRSGLQRTKPAATATTTAHRRIGGETTATAVARHRGGRGRRPANFVCGRRPFADGPRDRRLRLSDLVVWHPVGYYHDLAQSDSDYGGGIDTPSAPAATAVGSVVFGACRRSETQKELAY